MQHHTQPDGSTCVFAAWQPRYAAHGIATFPVVGKDKKPRITNWQHVGLPASKQLALKFADADAFGFPCGERSRITVVDIDSHQESVVAHAIKLFGPSPVIWRTGSGNYAMPYRYNGERRCIRPLQGLPIDILGSSGFAIAPPSMGETRLYEFEQGTLADFDRLPPLRVEKVALVEEPRLGSALVGQGQRHEMLKRALGHEIWHADDWESFLDRAITVGTMHCTPPLEATEITDLAAWFWRHKEAGLLRRVGHRHWTRDVFDLLLTDRNAGLLLHALHVEHPGESQKFVIANAWSKKLRMKRDTLAAKRKMLAVLGKIVLVTPATQVSPAVYRWP